MKNDHGSVYNLSISLAAPVTISFVITAAKIDHEVVGSFISVLRAVEWFFYIIFLLAALHYGAHSEAKRKSIMPHLVWAAIGICVPLWVLLMLLTLSGLTVFMVFPYLLELIEQLFMLWLQFVIALLLGSMVVALIRLRKLR